MMQISKTNEQALEATIEKALTSAYYEKLQEYKSTLIDSAVTGKIKVS